METVESGCPMAAGVGGSVPGTSGRPLADRAVAWSPLFTAPNNRISHRELLLAKMKRLQAIDDVKQELSCQPSPTGNTNHHLDADMSGSEDSDQCPVGEPGQDVLPEEHGSGVMRMVYQDGGHQVMVMTTDEYSESAHTDSDSLSGDSVVSGRSVVATSSRVCADYSPNAQHGAFVHNKERTDVCGDNQQPLFECNQQTTNAEQQRCDDPASQSVELTDTHTEEKSDICSVGLPGSSHVRQRHKMHSAEGPHKCDVCGAGYSSKYHLNRHKITHTGEKPFKCDICGSGFMSDSSVKSHKRIHTGEKPYVCDVCGVGFTLGGHLKAHKRRHTGEKPYKCEYCSKSFSSGSVLKRHTRIHTGERPYKCEFCTLGFSCDSYLQRHRRKHTGERPYKCDVCLAEFMQSCNLKIHKRIHTGEKPFKCDVCGLELAHKSSLKSHQRLHTGEKPYVCDVCGVKFTQSFGLKAHKVIHTGEKPYKCDVCGVEFTHRGSFRNHKKIHKRDNT